MTASAAILRISNQKNGHAGAYVHHSAINREHAICPVKVLVRRVLHVREHSENENAFLCAYWDDVGRGNVTDNNIRYAIKFAAKMLNYP